MAKKEYPGSIEDWNELRELRQQVQQGIEADPSAASDAQATLFAGLVQAESTAGLAYIADGIRYSLRKDKS